MKVIGSVKEDLSIEKRVSITQENIKKYINLGFEVQLSLNYGKHLGFEEKEYNELGVKFINDDKKLNNFFNLSRNHFTKIEEGLVKTISHLRGV